MVRTIALVALMFGVGVALAQDKRPVALRPIGESVGRAAKAAQAVPGPHVRSLVAVTSDRDEESTWVTVVGMSDGRLIIHQGGQDPAEDREIWIDSDRVERVVRAIEAARK